MKYEIYIGATKYARHILLGTAVAKTASEAIQKVCKQLSYLCIPDDVHFDALVVI